ncbi:MAG: ABC transporter substrate-binding protein [Actinomycetota bacterium]
MLQRLPSDWTLRSRLLTVGVALAVLVTGATVALVRDGDDESSRLAEEGPVAEAEDPRVTGSPGPTATTERGAGTLTDGQSTAPDVINPPAQPLDVLAWLRQPCSPRNTDQTGVTNDTITIGQIVTDSNQIPQQLRPAHEGLQAFVKFVNDRGGVCKRKIKLEYRNDNYNAAIHSADIRNLAGSALAFVGNESVFDFLDYEQNPPFAPQVQGGGGFVPDVGGLAFAYGRSQSNWHAGVVGSVSPVLVGGGQYRFFITEQQKKGTPCRKAGVVYLQEPTGASEDQARVGRVSLAQSWGGNLGMSNTDLYSATLIPPSTDLDYQNIVDQMVSDGMNCAFAYSDLESSVKLVKAMANRGVWPPSSCKKGDQCFRVAYVPLSAYDRKFIQDAGAAANSVSTFIPHVPLTETSNEAMRVYLDAIKDIPGTRPSTFSVLGFASGLMFVESLRSCPEAPTRSCIMDSLRKMKDFTAGGLLGGTTPFRTTRVSYDRYGAFDWKWIFNRSTALRVVSSGGKLDFKRINPKSGFLNDTIHVARGSPG